jgi:hypothetical protein
MFNIPMEGDAALQRLVNIHFRAPVLARQLAAGGRGAMLYFVFNPQARPRGPGSRAAVPGSALAANGASSCLSLGSSWRRGCRTPPAPCHQPSLALPTHR